MCWSLGLRKMICQHQGHFGNCIQELLLLTISAEKGDAEEQLSMGFSYEFGLCALKDLKKAVYWYRKAAAQGNIEAKRRIENLKLTNDHARARDGVRALYSGNYKVAYEKLKPEAEKGNAIAQYRLGQMYKLGYGFPKNDQKAINWFIKSAQLGNEDAQYELGILFSGGKNKDYKLAVRYFRDSAENKHFLAQYRLGVMYREGKGVIQDYVYAHMWFNLAIAEEGNVDSTRKSTSDLEKKMTPEQIAEAQKLAREWMEKHKKK